MKSIPIKDCLILCVDEYEVTVIESFFKFCLPTITQVPHSTVRSKMDDPANKPTPVEAYSCALSLSLESPVTDKQQIYTNN
jgi:hypothetical protein